MHARRIAAQGAQGGLHRLHATQVWCFQHVEGAELCLHLLEAHEHVAEGEDASAYRGVQALLEHDPTDFGNVLGYDPIKTVDELYRVDDENGREKAEKAIMAINTMRNGLGLSGRPDTTAARSQTTILAMDFILNAAGAKSSRSHTDLNYSLVEKGWSDLSRVAPIYSPNDPNQYGCAHVKATLESVASAIQSMTPEQRGMVTVHVRLSLQAVMLDNLRWPMNDAGEGATIRADSQSKLVETYVKPILDIARLTSRAPIININHDHRFLSAGNHRLRAGAGTFTGFLGIGACLALELRSRGCLVVHGSTFWSKMVSHMRGSRGFAIYEKQLFVEKMVAVCFLNHDKTSQWAEQITTPILAQERYNDI